uniref:hypothetical protein n=1 Tax=Armatimonas sp. TaxID=1872638 RepID=UPI0037532D2C
EAQKWRDLAAEASALVQEHGKGDTVRGAPSAGVWQTTEAGAPIRKAMLELAKWWQGVVAMEAPRG